MNPLFSIIMPSYLGNYQGAAKNREPKFLRAVDSVLEQTEMDWQLIIVADGCERTMEIVSQHYLKSRRIEAILIPKQKLWDPGVRNVGIRNAVGEWIHYLDTDDYYGHKHLEKIAAGLRTIDTDWAWFNDLTFDSKSKSFTERICDLSHKDKHGTSNLVHRRSLEVYWPEGTYKQDAHFASALKATGPGDKIPTPEYCVAHIPGRFDV